MPHIRLAGLRALRLPRVAHALALVCSVSVALAACGDEVPSQGERARVLSEAAGPHTAKWLELSSPISPAQWLASRGEAKPRPESDAEVQRIAGLLSAAHKRYRESERMVANRSVQVEDMLKQIGISEGAVGILDDLTSIGAEVGQTEGFGAISQYYFNLRAASVSRAEALATLKSRYGSKS